MRTLTLGIYTWLLCLSLGWSSLVQADAVADWNATAGKATVAACISPDGDPLHESRTYAMMHIAIHDAPNAIDRRYQPYILDLPETPEVSVPDRAVVSGAIYGRDSQKWRHILGSSPPGCKRNYAEFQGKGRCSCLAPLLRIEA